MNNSSRQNCDAGIRRLEAGIVVALTLPLWLAVVWPGRSVSGRPTNLETLVETGVASPLLIFAGIAGVILLFAWLAVRKIDTTIAVVLLGICLVVGVWQFQNTTEQQVNNLGLKSYPRSPRLPQAVLQGNPGYDKEKSLQIEKLIDIARLRDYNPSPEWCETFQAFGRHGMFALEYLVEEEPQIIAVFDALAKHRYQLTDDMTSEQAWDALMRIAADSREAKVNFSGPWADTDSPSPEIRFGHGDRAIKLLANQLDHQQVCDVLVAAIESGKWAKAFQMPPHYLGGGSPATKEDLANLRELQPVLLAASEINRNLNREFPDQYSLIELQVGNALFAQNMPAATPYFYSDLKDILERGQSDSDSRRFQPITPSEFRFPWFGSPDADEHIRRQCQSERARWVNRSLGDSHLFSKFAVQTGVSLRAHNGRPFGNVKISEWYRRLITMDSPTGREFRRTHREELIDLAIRSIRPIEGDPDSLSLTGSQKWYYRFASKFNNSDYWLLPTQLEFLFLDRPSNVDQAGTEQQPSLAREFWPQFDAMLDTGFPDVSDEGRLRLRWQYLSRIWPESDVKSFVDAYLKTPSLVRQYVMNNLRAADRGLPDKLPTDAKLKILKRLLVEVKNLPDSEKVKYRAIGSMVLTEEQTIQQAIGQLDCPEGAATFMDLDVLTFGIDGMPPIESLSPDKLAHGRARSLVLVIGDIAKLYPPERFARDDRFDLFASHENPALRRFAVALIEDTPKPRFMSALPALLKDTDPEVSAAAKQVKEKFDELLQTDLSTFTEVIQRRQ